MDLSATPPRPLHAERLDRLDVHCFPSSDAAFAARVSDLIHELDASDLSPLELESRLRLIYPDARVRVRDTLASLAPGSQGGTSFATAGSSDRGSSRQNRRRDVLGMRHASPPRRR